MRELEKTEKYYSLLYCRVSSKRQVLEGNGLDSQEKRCHDRSDAQGYIFEKLFPDEGVSGSLFDRPAMKALISYIDAHPNKKFVVIFDDLKRFARDYIVHLKIKAELVSRGVKLECLNFNFEDSDENEFIEGVLALQAQLERKQNRRQVIQKQKARLERGFWAFSPPLGLKSMKTKADGKVLIPSEPYASIYKEAIEGYERNVLITQDDVRQFIAKKYKECGIARNASIHGVQEMLKSPLYAGYVEYLPWGVERREGKHKGIISKDTFQNVQDKLLGRTRVKLRKDYNLDFPLRGWAECAECGAAFKASWVGGRTRRYPTYTCHTSGCSYRYKSVQKGRIEPEFEVLLQNKRIGGEVKGLTKAIFLDAWLEGKEGVVRDMATVKNKLMLIDEQIANLAKRVGSCNNQVLVEAYETQIEKLGAQRELIESKSSKSQFTEEQFGTALESVFVALENPLTLWKSDNMEDIRTVQYMYFDEPPRYDYVNGFGTVKYSDAIELFSAFGSDKTPGVETEGSEPSSGASF